MYTCVCLILLMFPYLILSCLFKSSFIPVHKFFKMFSCEPLCLSLKHCQVLCLRTIVYSMCECAYVLSSWLCHCLVFLTFALGLHCRTSVLLLFLLHTILFP